MTKYDILKTFGEKFALKWRFGDTGGNAPNGSADIYLPGTDTAGRRLGRPPVYSSMATLLEETSEILKSGNGNA